MKELIIVLLIFILSFIVLFLFWRFPFFLRNPKRKIPYDEKAILAPADGYVVYCKKIKPGNDIISIKKDISIKLDDLMLIDDKELQNQPGWHIGIFMTIFDVHYNRTPIRGHIKKLRHDFPTKNKENSSMFNQFHNVTYNSKPYYKNCENLITNERASYIIKNEKRSVYVTQIADRWVNKILTIKNNVDVKQGEVFGMIKIGSQVDVFIPDKKGSAKLLVSEGEKVYAGLTKILTFKS